MRTGLSDQPPAATTGPARDAIPGPVVCAIGLPLRLTEVGRAIRNAVTIERAQQNGVLLSGGGHSVLLFSQ